MTEHFNTHKASIVLHDGDIWVIDFKRADGRPHYAIRFYIDESISSVHIEGDLGYCISVFDSRNSLQSISAMMSNVPYWVGKFRCSSDKYIWDESEALRKLEDYTHNVYETLDDKDEYYEMIQSVMDTFSDTDGLMINTDEAYHNWFTEFKLEELDPSSLGRKVHPRVYLWAEALNIALDQLNMLKQDINKTTNYGEDC